MVLQQEKEIDRLRIFEFENDRLSSQNQVMKELVENLKLKIQDLEANSKKIQHSHNFMEHKVVEHNSRVLEMEREVDRQTKRSNQLQEKVNEQEIEIGSLVSCLDALRLQIVKFNQAGQPDLLS